MLNETPIDVSIILIAGSIAFAILIFFLISFLILYQKKQHGYLIEKASLKARFEKEILQSQIEVQNSTLKYIGQELHDNIGQLLSVTKINLGVMEESLARHHYEEFAFNFHQANDLITETINEVRSLSKSLDDNLVQEFGLTESIAYELQRIRKTKKFDTNLVILGERFSLGFEREIILFRIIQEILSNALKHSGAKNIEITLAYTPDTFMLTVKDDGKGFDLAQVMNRDLSETGAGLRNITRRVALINFNCELIAQKGQGTSYHLTTNKVLNVK